MSDFNSKQILEFTDNLLEFVSQNEIAELKYRNKDKYISECNNKFKEYFERFPKLFFLIIDNPQEYIRSGRNRLLKQLKMKDNIDNKKISFEEASQKIGKEYYNKYVKPVIKEDAVLNTEQKPTNEISQLINQFNKNNIKDNTK